MKQNSQVQFDSVASIVVDQKHDQNSSFFSRLDSSFKYSNELVPANAIATRIYVSLTDEIAAIIKFANSILSDQAKYFGEQHIRYKIKQLKKTGTFVILNHISDYVTLVKLMDSLGNVNHAVSVVGKWSFYSNYGKALPLTID